MLGPRLQDPMLWHVNRRSIPAGLALGVFCAFIPVPFQMVIAAVGAILFRVNILVAVPAVWLSNPLTIPPLYFFCYLVGVRLLGVEPTHFSFELSFDWLLTELVVIWQPFLLGCFLVGAVCALSVSVLVRILWQLHILQHLKDRAARLHNRNFRARKRR